MRRTHRLAICARRRQSKGGNIVSGVRIRRTVSWVPFHHSAKRFHVRVVRFTNGYSVSNVWEELDGEVGEGSACRAGAEVQFEMMLVDKPGRVFSGCFPFLEYWFYGVTWRTDSIDALGVNAY